MKRRMHIYDFLLAAIAKSLREAGREDDAQLMESIKGADIRPGYINGGRTEYGSSGNPWKTVDGNIQFYGLAVERKLVYKNGLPTNFSPSGLNTIAMIPKEYRPPYLGDIAVSKRDDKIDLEEIGGTLSKNGCYYVSIGQNSDGFFVIVVGSDEDPTNYIDIMKYLPFDIFPNQISGSITKRDPADYGYSAQIKSSLSGNNVMPFNIYVYQGTTEGSDPEPMNPNLPNFKWNDLTPTVPKGYKDLGTLNVTFDWSKLAGKYTSKVHINQIFLDALYDALITAGNTSAAEDIKKINVETFIPWQLTTDTANKTTTMVGARDTTSKIYIGSVKFNHYNNATLMQAINLGFVYSPSAGISFDTVEDLNAIAAKTDTKLYAESKYGYFGKHITKGSPFNTEVLEEIIPFSIKGLDIPVNSRDSITTATQQYFSNSQINMVFMGNNSYRIYLYPDK